MSQRIRVADVAGHLDDAGYEPSEWNATDRDWDPGYRAAQHGPRIVHVFHDGPAEAHHLDLYTQELRAHGLQVVPQQLDERRNGPRRLAVTKP
jgi:hypothetical protein